MGTTKRNLLKRFSIFPLITSLFKKNYDKQFTKSQEPSCLFWIKTKGKRVKRTKPQRKEVKR